MLNYSLIIPKLLHSWFANNYNTYLLPHQKCTDLFSLSQSSSYLVHFSKNIGPCR